jgi:hypothetical protein
MKRYLLFLCLAMVAWAGAQPREIVVNRLPLNPEVLAKMEQHFQIRVPDGYYWYDPVCGAWGQEGGPTLGFTAPSLNLGGYPPEDISRGNTGVFVNGRHLPLQDLLALQRLTGPIQRGSYWLDAEGNAGFVGGPAIVNLRSLARGQGHYRQGSGVGQAYRSGGAGYHNSNTGIGIITDGQGGATVFTP